MLFAMKTTKEINHMFPFLFSIKLCCCVKGLLLRLCKPKKKRKNETVRNLVSSYCSMVFILCSPTLRHIFSSIIKLFWLFEKNSHLNYNKLNEIQLPVLWRRFKLFLNLNKTTAVHCYHYKLTEKLWHTHKHISSNVQFANENYE